MVGTRSEAPASCRNSRRLAVPFSWRSSRSAPDRSGRRYTRTAPSNRDRSGNRPLIDSNRAGRRATSSAPACPAIESIPGRRRHHVAGRGAQRRRTAAGCSTAWDRGRRPPLRLLRAGHLVSHRRRRAESRSRRGQILIIGGRGAGVWSWVHIDDGPRHGRGPDDPARHLSHRRRRPPPSPPGCPPLPGRRRASAPALSHRRQALATAGEDAVYYGTAPRCLEREGPCGVRLPAPPGMAGGLKMPRSCSSCCSSPRPTVAHREAGGHLRGRRPAPLMPSARPDARRRPLQMGQGGADRGPDASAAARRRDGTRSSPRPRSGRNPALLRRPDRGRQGTN